jgi:hypothetical protein
MPASADDLPPLGEPIAESARTVRGITVHGNVIVTAAGPGIAVRQPALPPPTR